MSPGKRIILDEGRQVHPGLAKMKFKINTHAAISTPPLDDEISILSSDRELIPPQ